jgi:REP element-mobilizing transposase RayT
MPVNGTSPRLRGFDYRTQRTYFVTFCVRNRQPIFGNPATARIAKNVIIDYRNRGWYWLQAYCVMPDHIHLMVRLRNDARTLSQVVGVIKNQISYRLRRAGFGIGWQMGFHDRVKRLHEDERFMARYIVENPVRAGLVARFDEYEFASIVDDWR